MVLVWGDSLLYNLPARYPVFQTCVPCGEGAAAFAQASFGSGLVDFFQKVMLSEGDLIPRFCLQNACVFRAFLGGLGAF